MISTIDLSGCSEMYLASSAWGAGSCGRSAMVSMGCSSGSMKGKEVEEEIGE